MKQSISVTFLVAVIVGAAIAYPEPGQPESSVDLDNAVEQAIRLPEPGQPESVVDLNNAVDEAIRQQIAEYVAIIYGTVKEPKLDGNLETFEELIAASLPEDVHQDVANELSDEVNAGTLSDGLKERIRRHTLDWFLQYLPEDLRVDITTVLEEYRTTGQVLENNEELVARLRHYVASVELDPKRSKRGFWSGLCKVVAKYCIQYIITSAISFFG